MTPLRKAPGFVPAVQRWSHQLPAGETQFRVGFFGAQSPDTVTLNHHPLHAWATEHLLNHPNGPTCVDHAYQYELVAPVIADPVAMFGADRCLYGSNFPVEKLCTDCASLYGTSRRAIEPLSEIDQQKILSDTATRLYRL